jgi:hypothetical protein
LPNSLGASLNLPDGKGYGVSRLSGRIGIVFGVIGLVAGGAALVLAVSYQPVDKALYLLAPAANGEALSADELARGDMLLHPGSETVPFGDDAYGRLALHRAVRSSGEDRTHWSGIAAGSFASALGARPNTPDAWRRYLTAVVLGGAETSRIVPITDAVSRFEPGEPASALLLVELLARAPEAFSEDGRQRTERMVTKLEYKQGYRIRLARLAVALDPPQREVILDLVLDRARFEKLVRWLEMKAAAQS